MQAPSQWCRWASLPCPSVREAAFMYSTAVAVFLVILVAALQGSAPPESPFLYRIPLDPEGSLELSWNVSYTQEAIFFQLLVKQLKAGVLFGMSDRGELENADLVVLWTDGDTAYFADAWSDQKGKIHLDPQQDYQLLQVQRTPEGLVLLFKRPFGTCDPKDYLIEDGTVHLVYGILEEPFRSLEAINSSGLRTGLQRVQLLKPNITFPAIPSDTCTMDIHAPDIQIPNQVTTYWCYIHELPEGFPRHHIVKYEPIITKGNEALVHHMEIFQCAPEMDNVPHFSGPCDSKMKPDRLNYCRHVLAAWALGAKAFYYPEEAGIAFGGPGSSRYVRLEVHYHNPLVIEGRRDSSGIRLYYTDKLRRFNAGIMELGLVYTPVMAIPPRETAFVLTGYCTDKCTQLVSGVGPGFHALHFKICLHYVSNTHVHLPLKSAGTAAKENAPLIRCRLSLRYPLIGSLCASRPFSCVFQEVNGKPGEGAFTEVRTPQKATWGRRVSSVWDKLSLRARTQEVAGKAATHLVPPASVYLLLPSLQGEWNLQPLPKVIPTLEEPTPQCPTSQDQSPAGPTIISIGGGKG
uniref:Dopamine beta-hydroxylase n=1 Tax=Piliocolobus tephrosceles TaxID=591936 RepID=A0A8C9I8Z8_9PRIM